MSKIRCSIYQFACFLLVYSVGYCTSFSQSSGTYYDQHQYVVKHWNNEDGLPQNTIFDIEKDKTGFLWLSTEEGLVRFDGNEFTNFDGQYFQNLPSNYFTDITPSSTGGIWAVARYAIVKVEEFSSELYDLESFVGNSVITAIVEGEDGQFWFGTQSGRLFVMKSGDIKEKESWNYTSGAIQHLKRTIDGILIGTSDGLFKWKNKTESINPFLELDSLNVRALEIEKSGNIWVGTEKRGLLKISGEKVKQFSTDQGLPEPFITSLAIDQHEKIWVGTSSSGLYILENDKFQRSPENEFIRDDIKSISVSDQNTIWIGSSGSGLMMLKRAEINKLDNDFQLSQEIMLPVYQHSNSDIWIGTAGKGLFKLKNGTTEQFTTADGLANEIILSVYGTNDAIFAGTAGGLSRYNLQTGEFEKTFTVEDGLANNIVQSVFLDSKDRLWVASRSGGLHILEDNELNQIKLPNEVSAAIFLTTFEDKSGNIWVGSLESGLISIKPDSSIIHYTTVDGLPTNIIHCFYQDPDGGFWIGTEEGLVYKDGNQFYTLDKSNGLESNLIYNIVKDERDNLWLSHNFGLQRISYSKLKKFKTNLSDDFQVEARSFNSSDGMANSEANGGVFPAGWKMQNGDIWFPTVKGVAIINPDAISHLQSLPNIHIQNMRFGDRLFTPNQKIQVPPGVHNIQINYTSINFSNPKTIRFSYRLQGLSNEWHQIENQRTAYFSTLSPGDYTFEVQSSQYGITSNISSINFKVMPFFYQTWWFRLSSLILIFLAGFAAKQLHTKSKEEEKLKKLVDERTKVLQQTLNEKDVLVNEIHHRVKNNLAIISALMELQAGFSENKELKDILNDNQSRIKSIASIHEFLYQLESFSELNFKKVLEKLLADISDIYASDKKISFQTEIEPVKLNVNQAIPLALLINEMISNSYKHAFPNKDQGTITIRLKEDAEHVHVEVRDNGIGFSSTKNPDTSTYLGLKLIQVQTKQLNANLNHINENGTVYQIEFEKTHTRGSASNIL